MRCCLLIAVALVTPAQEPEVESLLKDLADDSIEVRDRAVKSLVVLGAKAEAAVKSRMEASEGEVRHLCRKVLEGISWRKRVDAVLPPMRRVTLDAKDRPVKQVLSDLQARSGCPIESSQVDDAPVTLRVKDASVLEAAAAISKAARLGFTVGIGKGATSPAVWFNSRDPAEFPRTFSGPFMVEVLSVTLTRSTQFRGNESTGSIQIRLMWPPGVDPDTALLNVSSIVDDKGTTLWESTEKSAFGMSGQEGMMGRGPVFASTAHLQFKLPADDAEKISSVRGSAMVYFAGEDRFLTFEASEKDYGRKKELAGVAAELRGVKVEGEVTTVTYATQGWPRPAMSPSYRTLPKGLGVRSYVVTLDDGTVPVSSHGGTRHDGPWRVEERRFFNLKSKVATVAILAETVFHRETFDFELKDIPLPK